MPFAIDLAQEHEVLLEVPAGQEHAYVLTCSADVIIPVVLIILVHEHAHCTLTWLQKTSLTAQVTYRVILVGQKAHISTLMRIVTTKKDTVQVTVLVDHQAPDTHSLCDVKGVAYDTSMFNFNGCITLSSAAHYAQANMHHKHLVVGQQARVRSCPELEALHHTVQCGHGSAISYIDDDQLFYLSSRGLDEVQARTMIINSFLS